LLLRNAAHGLAAEAVVLGERALLVLEDADWLVSLAAGIGDAGEVMAARELWTELGELAVAGVAGVVGVVGVVVTAVRGFLLQPRKIGTWENPVASGLVVIQLRGLSLEGVEHIVRDLGADVGVGFDDAAVARIGLVLLGVTLQRRVLVALRRVIALARPHRRSEKHEP
jgi:hypothetical protein